VNDGTAPRSKKNPSSPLIVRLHVNHQLFNVMVDTGSANSIIHINTLRKLKPQPHIKHLKNIYRTANNSELHTIGLVKLKINIKNISTFILAEVALDLCTGLILGNDWIQQNGIDIITTQQNIRKRQGQKIVTVPFSNYYKNYPIMTIVEIKPLPEQQSRKLERVEMENDDTSPVPIPTLESLSLLPEQQAGTNTSNQLQCRTCYKKFPTKKKLFDHLYQQGHYSKGGERYPSKQLSSTVWETIRNLVEHITNSRDRKQVELILMKNAKMFDTSKGTTINTTVKHTIEVKNSPPIVQRPYRKTEAQEKIIEEMCEKFYKNGIIRPSQSPWASPIVLQKK
jgi:hypothetical protein